MSVGVDWRKPQKKKKQHRPGATLRCVWCLKPLLKLSMTVLKQIKVTDDEEERLLRVLQNEVSVFVYTGINKTTIHANFTESQCQLDCININNTLLADQDNVKLQFVQLMLRN